MASVRGVTSGYHINGLFIVSGSGSGSPGSLNGNILFKNVHTAPWLRMIQGMILDTNGPAIHRTIMPGTRGCIVTGHQLLFRA